MSLTKRQLVDRIEEIGEEMESHRRAILALEEERDMFVELLNDWIVDGDANGGATTIVPEPTSEPPDTLPGTPRSKESSQKMRAVVVHCSICGFPLVDESGRRCSNPSCPYARTV